MISKGKGEIGELENVYYVSVESSLRQMLSETAFGFDHVQSHIELPCSMNFYVYTQETTLEKIFEVCKDKYLQRNPYKSPQIWVNTIHGEATSICFRRLIDDVYPKEQYDNYDLDYGSDWSYSDEDI